MYDRDALIAATDLRHLADELLGPHHGGERTPTWRCPNPQHAQTGRTPPVNVFTSRRGEPRWRCHGCGEGGTAIDLVMICRGIGPRDALDELARRAGRIPEPPSWEPTRPIRRERPLTPDRCRDPEALGAYVDACAATLWEPAGRPIRRWLTEERGLPERVLKVNKIGADLGPRRQSRPDGMCRMGGAVLPVIADGQAIYAQVRVPHPRPDRPRYLNPTADLAPNPRLARFRPAAVEHPEVIITEGAIDALSANAAGYRAVAILSAGYPDPTIAHALSRIHHPLVIAFDNDDAGRQGAQRLHDLLADQLRPAPCLDLEESDLNEALLAATDWRRDLVRAVMRASFRNGGRTLA
ncbi:MAG: toprim domain-containing protein [Acidimicrobiia bacterium]|nr:toprim domain-containing protein [Acidimicrobiia bacterium]